MTFCAIPIPFLMNEICTEMFLLCVLHWLENCFHCLQEEVVQ